LAFLSTRALWRFATGCGDVVVVVVVGTVRVVVVGAVVVVARVVVVGAVVVVMAVVVGDVVVVAVSVVVAPKDALAEAARAVATPRAATTALSRRSEIARRIAKVWRSPYLFAPAVLGVCPSPVKVARALRSAERHRRRSLDYSSRRSAAIQFSPTQSSQGFNLARLRPG
jgi:hypothetical protein